jgi:hypothetical protein
MRNIIQRTALILTMVGVFIWLIGGAKIGFFVTQEYISFHDPIAQIDGGKWHPKFLPGIEPLIISCILAGSIFLGSFLISKNS